MEVQGTAEQSPFSRDELSELLGLGEEGIRTLFEAQRRAVAGLSPPGEAGE